MATVWETARIYHVKMTLTIYMSRSGELWAQLRFRDVKVASNCRLQSAGHALPAACGRYRTTLRPPSTASTCPVTKGASAMR
jgi:hypothetical protein